MGCLLLWMVFPLAGQAAQKGQVVYASNSAIFFQRGGDPATQAGGLGPLIATTVFEGLIDMGVNIASLPSVSEILEDCPGLDLC